MPSSKSGRADPSWLAVILLLVLFWPAGLYLLYRKFSVPPFGRGGVVFLLIGFAFTGIAALDILKRATGWPPVRGDAGFLLSSPVYTAVALAAGLLCFVAAGLLLQRRRDYRLYTPFLLGHVTTSLDAVADALSRDYLRVCRDLQRLINTGCLSSAYIDHTHRLFVFSRQWLASPPPPPAAGSEDEPEEAVPGNAGAARLLDQIRERAGKIRNPRLSNRILQIEGLCGKIFEVVTSQPEKQPQIRAFMQYYLPAALRLLDTYSRLESQQVHGDTIDKTMRDVEEMADTLAEAFKKQLDQLFSGEALDVSAEIKVMETMLRRDGLLEDHPFSPPD